MNDSRSTPRRLVGKVADQAGHWSLHADPRRLLPGRRRFSVSTTFFVGGAGGLAWLIVLTGARRRERKRQSALSSASDMKECPL